MSIYKRIFSNEMLLKDYRLYLLLNKKTILRFFVLAFLILYHCVLKRKKLLFYPECCESSIFKRDSVDSLVSKLNKYDVISFDIFDTLIFRPFEKPTDCFYLLEAQNRLLWFPNYRRKAEKCARKKTPKNNGEIDIYDIYEELKNYYGLEDIKAMVTAELDLEYSICYPNPYMLEVYKRLVAEGKRLIATSDMYIPSSFLRKMLDKCGYDKISDIFVSCEYGASKKTGRLPQIVQSKLGPLNVIHLDDDKRCISGCDKAGWKTYWYNPCKNIGQIFRNESPVTPTSQMYRGLINNYLHCGANNLDPQEELGFVYAGIAVCGYDEWLSDFCIKNDCDKILFLARDMDIFYQVYDKFYGQIPHCYVQSSRNALRQLTFEYCFSDFFEFLLSTRRELKKKVGEVLEELDLDFLKKYASVDGLDLNEISSQDNEDQFIDFILRHREEVIKNFNKADEVAKKYFAEMIGDAKKICIAGLGWAGTEIVQLQWLIEKKWKLPVKVVGALFGTNCSKRVSNTIFSHDIHSFAFGEMMNRDISLRPFDDRYMARVAIENIFTSPEASLIKFIDDGRGGVDFIRKESNPNCKLVKKVQDGVNLFAQEFLRHRKPYMNSLPIFGTDAQIPLFTLLNNKKYLSLMLGDFVEKPNAISGLSKDDDYIKYKDLLLNASKGGKL